jgi:hypothetical protein
MERRTKMLKMVRMEDPRTVGQGFALGSFWPFYSWLGYALSQLQFWQNASFQEALVFRQVAEHIWGSLGLGATRNR